MAPILSLPFRLTNAGQVAVVTQDTDQANAEQIAAILDTVQGERTMQPGFGLPDPAFGPIPSAAIVAQVALWGPDVTIDDISATAVSATETDITVSFT